MGDLDKDIAHLNEVITRQQASLDAKVKQLETLIAQLPLQCDETEAMKRKTFDNSSIQDLDKHIADLEKIRARQQAFLAAKVKELKDLIEDLPVTFECNALRKKYTEEMES